MQYFELMQLFEPLDHLYEDMPDVGLTKALIEGLLFGYLSGEITVAGIFHHNTVYLTEYIP